jgi:gliding motility-associated-like protein
MGMKYLYTLFILLVLSGPARSQIMLADDASVVSKKTGVILNTSNCENRAIVFSTTGTQGDVQSYLWDFGTGETSNLANPGYTYTEAGDYQVTLTLTYTNGSIETFTKQLHIGKVPVPDFTASVTEGNYPFTVQFTNMTSGVVLTYLWNFGNYATSNVMDPNHVYANATKEYDVTLTAVSPDGCEASVTKPAYIRVNGQPVYTLFVPNSFSPNGDGLNEIFMVHGENIRDVQLEIFDQTGRMVFSQNGEDPMIKGWNGTNLSNSQLPVGSYTYKIIATDYFGVTHESMGTVNLMK